MFTKLPVSAIPMISRFNRPIGIACLWMGVGSYIQEKDKKHPNNFLPLYTESYGCCIT